MCISKQDANFLAWKNTDINLQKRVMLKENKLHVFMDWYFYIFTYVYIFIELDYL